MQLSKLLILVLILPVFFLTSCNFFGNQHFECIDDTETIENSLSDNTVFLIPNIVVSSEESKGSLNIYLYVEDNNNQPIKVNTQSVNYNLSNENGNLLVSSSELEAIDDYRYELWINENDYIGKAEIAFNIQLENNQELDFIKTIQFISCDLLTECDNESCDLLNCQYFNQFPDPVSGIIQDPLDSCE